MPANDEQEMTDFNDEFNSHDPIRFPIRVRIAGIIWIVYGALQLISGILQLAQRDAKSSSFCGWFIAASFLVIGIQTVKGSAKGTLGNGIGSILFSLLLITFAGFFSLIIAGVAGEDVKQRLQFDQFTLMVLSIFLFALGVLLIIAGTLAITGRNDYKAWQEANNQYRN